MLSSPIHTKGPEDVQADQARANFPRLALSQLRVQYLGDVVVLDLLPQVS